MTEQDSRNGDLSRSSFSGLPDYPGNPFLISEIACQECETIRPGIKSYSVPHLIFLFFFVVWRLDNMVKCPRCIRGYLCRRFLLAVLLANVLSPIILILWSVLFLRTFFR